MVMVFLLWVMEKAPFPFPFFPSDDYSSMVELKLFMHSILRFKDGVPINRSSTCYKMSGFTLIIVNVQQQNAGVFTVSLGNQARGLHRNLSFTLIVEGKLLL